MEFGNKISTGNEHTKMPNVYYVEF